MISIVNAPTKPPDPDPRITPAVKEINEVNSTLGGLGVSCIPIDRAVNTLSKAN